MSRLCKLGLLRIKLPSVTGFRQELRIVDGEIRIITGGTTTRVWIDAKQPVGDKLLFLPAWPKKWDVNFKLHDPQNTTIEGVVKNGAVVTLIVTPESRGKDVEISTPFVLNPSLN